MLSKPKFTRKQDPIKATQEKYRLFIESVQNLSQDPSLQDEEKIAILTNDYSNLASSNIEVNEQFLNALETAKTKIFEDGDITTAKSFINALYLMKKARLLSTVNYTDLNDFKGMKPKASTSSVRVNLLADASMGVSLARFEELRGFRSGFQSSVPELKALSFEEFKGYVNGYYAKELFQCLEPELETEETLRKKKAAFEIAEKIFNVVDFGEFSTELKVERLFYGSSVNRVYTSSSDIDITLATNDENCDERELLKFFQGKFQGFLFPQESFKVEKLLFKGVRYPLVDVKIEPLGITISFSVNNKLGAINSKLLEIYSNLDPRCKMLALLVKIWAKIHRVSSAKMQFLSSYAYNLMVINFLQMIKPPILPSLQKIREADNTRNPVELRVMPRGKDIDVKEPFLTRIDYEDNIEKLQEIMMRDYSENKMTVIELLKLFFQAYNDPNNFEEQVISVKEGGLIDRPFLGKDGAYLYSIEDPFDLHHNPGHNVKKNSGQATRILSAMKRSFELIRDGKIIEAFQPFENYHVI